MKIEWMVCCILSACDTSSSPHRSCPTGVMVATSDFSNASEVGVLPLDGTAPALNAASVLGADPALVSSSGRNFFIERDREGNIYELDACGDATATYASHDSTENMLDPQDVAVADDGALWVARLFAPSALVIGPTIWKVDLSSADADGRPNMSAVRIAGGKAFIALGLLDDGDPNLVARRPAEMAIVDVETRVLEALIPIAGRNPIAAMPQSGDTLWIATMGDIDRADEADAGIVTFETDIRASSLLVPESLIGGSVSAIAIDDHCGAAIAFDGTPNVNHTFVVAFDTSGAIVQRTAFGPTSGFDLAGLAWIDGRLLVGDRRLVAGAFAVHTFVRDSTCALAQGPDLSLPMAPVAFVAQ